VEFQAANLYRGVVIKRLKTSTPIIQVPEYDFVGININNSGLTTISILLWVRLRMICVERDLQGLVRRSLMVIKTVENYSCIRLVLDFFRFDALRLPREVSEAGLGWVGKEQLNGLPSQVHFSHHLVLASWIFTSLDLKSFKVCTHSSSELNDLTTQEFWSIGLYSRSMSFFFKQYTHILS
jgi:hypothetical protein